MLDVLLEAIIIRGNGRSAVNVLIYSFAAMLHVKHIYKISIYDKV